MTTKKEKTIDRIHFYSRRQVEGTHMDKPIYAAWPRTVHSDPSTAINWATSRSYNHETRSWGEVEPHQLFEMENRFTDVAIPSEPDKRWSTGSKIPQALIPGPDCWLLVDFRLDGLLELLNRRGAEDGFANEPLSFRFVNSNYYLTPTEGPAFVEYKKAFEISNRPKTKKNTQIEVGVPFKGSYDFTHVYLGAYSCIRDEMGSNEGQLFHMYQQFYDEKHHVDRAPTMIKSRMQVKGPAKISKTAQKQINEMLAGEPSVFEDWDGRNLRTVTLNHKNKTVTFEAREPAVQTGRCWW